MEKSGIFCVSFTKNSKDYLQKHNYCTSAIELTLQKLKDYGYINDEYYAKTYVEFASKGKGKRYVKNDLKSKGITEDVLDDITKDTLNEDNYEKKQKTGVQRCGDRPYNPL